MLKLISELNSIIQFNGLDEFSYEATVIKFSIYKEVLIIDDGNIELIVFLNYYTNSITLRQYIILYSRNRKHHANLEYVNFVFKITGMA
jgi:hypothetical protein